MLSLEILSKNGTISRAYSGEPVVIPKVEYTADDFRTIEFTGEQVWLCNIIAKGEIKPIQLCGFIYKLKEKKGVSDGKTSDGYTKV